MEKKEQNARFLLDVWVISEVQTSLISVKNQNLGKENISQKKKQLNI